MDIKDKAIDFICQHCADGSIIPIKFRIKDEEGEFKDFKINGYKDTSDTSLTKFECSIAVNNVIKKVTIYNPTYAKDNVWRIKY